MPHGSHTDSSVLYGTAVEDALSYRVKGSCDQVILYPGCLSEPVSLWT